MVDPVSVSHLTLAVIVFCLDLRLSSRIDAVAQRVNTAVKMQSLTKDMSGIVKSMDQVMKTMNVEKINEVMDKFEQQFENLDLATGVMENSMVSSTAQSMPESQVENLMQQVADEHGLEFSSGLNQLPNGINKLGQKVPAEEQKAKPGVVLAGAPQGGNNKDNKGDDNKPSSGGSSSGGVGGGGSVMGGGGGGAADDDESSLEDRLKRLQQ